MLLQGWPLWPLKGLNLKAEVAAFLVACVGGDLECGNLYLYILYHTVGVFCSDLVTELEFARKLFLKSPSSCLASQDLIWPVIYKPCIASSIPTGRSMLQLSVSASPPTTLIIGLPPAPGPAAEGVVPSEPVSTTSQKHHPYYSPKMCGFFCGKLPIVKKSSEKDIHLLRGPNKLLYMSKEIPRCGRAIAGRAKSPYFWQCYYISYAHSEFYQYAI